MMEHERVTGRGAASPGPEAPVDDLHVGDHRLRKGDRVRLRPRPKGDIFDLALAGQAACVESIEQDFEGQFYVAVVVDQDPGRSIGPRGPGHRFFFAPDEIEWLGSTSGGAGTAASRSILVAGVGNIFLGDDGFGVEVAQRLTQRRLPDGVLVTDFGIRGYDLAYALLAGHDDAILVDACPRGGAPGTVFVIDPEVETDMAEPSALDAHDMHPLHVLRLARSLGEVPRRVRIVGCEPATLGPPEGQLGLSEPVAAAVDRAVATVEALISDFLRGDSAPQTTSDAPTRR